MDIVRGQLDEISRPASDSRTRPGSRVASAASPDRRRLSVRSSGAMVVLTPEPILPQERSDPLDNHINSTDSTANSSFENLDSQHETFNEQDGVNSLDTDRADARTPCESKLSPEEHLDSIVQEMHVLDKSADCEVDPENHFSTADQTKPSKESDHNKQEDLDYKAEDAQLEEAIMKMEKLDKILVMKQEKERQVKKQGEELRKKLWEELQEKSEKEAQKKASSRNMNIGISVAENREELVECPEVAENTKKFLALTPTGNGVDLEVTPIFHTQLPVEEYERANDERDQDCQDSSERVKLTSETKLPSDANSKNAHYKDQRNQTFSQNRIKVKDFVKKNIELAKEAKNPVLLTDDEKKRLAELLMDVEADSSISEDTSVPWALSVVEREGYTPEPMDQQQLADINAKLQVFNLDDDFPMITSSLSSIQTQNYQGTVSSQVEIGPGEEVLIQLRDERELHLRMEVIEQQLKNLETAFSEPSIDGVPYISKDQLTSLLDECIRCQSLGRISGNEDLDSDSVASSSFCSPRPQSLTVYNSPRLSETILSQLLADAYNSGLSPAPSRGEGESKISTTDLESEDPAYYRNKAMVNISRLAVSRPDDNISESELGEWMVRNNGESYMTRALEIKQAKKPVFLDDPSFYEFTDQELSTNDSSPTIPKLPHIDLISSDKHMPRTAWEELLNHPVWLDINNISLTN
ncbi:fibrous sheath-interacting protein 1 [Chiloscyllium plagiosum]|uniref:fibrous sheath-interacting protein 1 n=1 Tax=Chiloscyllium plagiosum TaxID=36176 RepID=UPI001CB7ECF2|nr:fibrous sheath-interacting protein 1 [Chiloscyllium plagiosum]